MAHRCPKCHTDNPPDSKFCKECAAPLTDSVAETPEHATQTIETPREELTTGSTFADRYRIIEELGRGGMGKVYKVFDTEIHEKIALKLITPELAADEKTIERFRNELKSARNISHKHVCRMYDLNREAGTYYLTMEYIAGEDLKNMIRMSKQLSIGTAVHIGRQVCAGLAEAHKAGIVHRDLKPGNIMIDRDGNARIMDFGIARSAAHKRITGRGAMIGTPEYMSPEQIEAKDVDSRSDIYSLGIILYEMLTGKLPFEGDTALAVGLKQKSEAPEDPVKLNPRIPSNLSSLILKCLEKDKEKRFQNASEAAAALEGIEKSLPTTEKTIPSKKPLTSREITVQLSPKKIVIPALFLFAVILIAGYFLIRPRPDVAAPVPTDKPSLAVLYFENNSGSDTLDHWRSGLCELLITDLSQSKYLHVLSGEKVYTLLEKLDILDRGKYTTHDLRQVASQGGVNHILRGNFMTADDTFIINISLLDAGTGTVVASLREDGIGEGSISESVDKITRAVKTALNFTPQQIESDIDKQIGVVTTHSPEAYKYYVEGIRYDVKGEYKNVIENMEKAIAIDPEFASAYHAMAWSYHNLSYYDEGDEYLKKALELSDRLSEREKYLIRGAYYMDVERDLDEAEKALLRLVELYPDDISGHNYLGIVYVRKGDREKSIHHYSRAIELGTEDVVIYTNLAGAYSSKGLLDKRKEILESYLKNVGDNARIRRSLSYSYRLEGQYEKALTELEKARSLSPHDMNIFLDMGDVHLYAGDWEKAEEMYMRLVASDDASVRWRGNRTIATLRLLQGKFDEFESRVREGIEQSKQLVRNQWIRSWMNLGVNAALRLERIDWAMETNEELFQLAVADKVREAEWYYRVGRGMVSLARNDLTAAQKTADELQKLILDSGGGEYDMGYYYWLQGIIELENKRYDRAYEVIDKSQSTLSAMSGTKIWNWYFKGTALFRANDITGARKEYEHIISHPTGRLGYGDLYVKAFYHLGIIHEKQGNKAQAVEHYTTFLDLWKDADPGIPEVEDARTRLAGLQ